MSYFPWGVCSRGSGAVPYSSLPVCNWNKLFDLTKCGVGDNVAGSHYAYSDIPTVLRWAVA